ncbi:ead/Ea22-like family protein [Pseudomonas monsensis]
MSKPNAAQRLAADLAMLAKAATPGPWVIDGDYVNEHGSVTHAYIANGRRGGGRIAGAFANCLVKTDEQCRANAEFIAGANPKAVLVLTREIERLLSEIDTLEACAKSLRDQWRADGEESKSADSRKYASTYVDAIAPTHDRTSCCDDDLYNAAYGVDDHDGHGRCRRCTLLAAAHNGGEGTAFLSKEDS